MAHIREVGSSASSYHQIMKEPGKDREQNFHLPPGYHASLDPEVLILKRADGSQVALFSREGFVAERVEQAAWADYDESEGASWRCTSSERLHPRPPR
jgi:hypothetical protein